MNPGSTYSDSFSRSEYPAYPVLTPSGSSNFGHTYNSGQQRSQDTAAYYGQGANGQHQGPNQHFQVPHEQRPYSQPSYGAEKPYQMPQQTVQVHLSPLQSSARYSFVHLLRVLVQPALYISFCCPSKILSIASGCQEMTASAETSKLAGALH